MSADIDPLCCCEYFDINNQRNHILLCCCNCEDLDATFESAITAKPIPAYRKKNLIMTLQDRMRIPWRGGARQISLDILLPVAFLPLIFLLASVSIWWTVVVFTVMIFTLSYLYHVIFKHLPQLKFFFVWTLTSILILYGIFEIIVIPFLEITPEENTAAHVLLLFSAISFYLAKRKTRNEEHGDQKYDHSLWFNCVITPYNRCLFISGLSLSIATLLYSSNLTLTSVCHPFRFYKTILLPDDCSDGYEMIQLALAFVSAIYSILAAVVLLIILVKQFFKAFSNCNFIRYSKGNVLSQALRTY